MAATTKVQTVTQREVGSFYVSQHQADTIYARSSWHRYRHGVWAVERDELIQRELWDLLQIFEGQKRIRPTHSIVRGVNAYIQCHLDMPEDQIDSRDNLINLMNGTYDLNERELLPHDSADFLTTQLPFDFDPTATCSTWDYYLQTSLVKEKPDEHMHDPDLAKFLQEAVGYSLTTSVKHQVSFWCYGGGANGKGTLFSVLQGLCGNSLTILDLSQLKRDRYQLADLAGKRVAICSEANTDQSQAVQDADLKTIIAGDPMKVRQIRERPFILYPKAKVWWAFNDLPNAKDTSQGFWRRVKVLPFNRHFATKDRIDDLPDMLMKEMPGIFNWALEGLFRLQDRGSFTEPKQIKNRTEEYQRESNTVGLFIDDVCVIGATEKVRATDLYAKYREWAKDNGFSQFSSRSFKREMIKLDFEHKHMNRGSFYQGVNLAVAP